MAAPKLPDEFNCIYGLALPGGDVRYVGLTATKGIRSRMHLHRWEARHGNPRPIYAWMRKVGVDDVEIRVLERLGPPASLTQLAVAEIEWVRRLREEGVELLNMTSGGLGMNGGTHTAETRAKLAESARRQDTGHLHTPENREKRRQAHVGIKHKPHVFTDITTQVRSGARGAHNRWHVARNITKDDCSWCTTSNASDPKD